MSSLLILTLLLMILFVVISIIASIIPSTILLIWRKQRKKSVPSADGDPNRKQDIIHNIIIEFLRSFDCGLLLATLFLQLIPMSRKSFELFFLQMSATNVKTLVLVRTDFVDAHDYKGIPFVELMICLSFFGIYFCEEFIQTCLKYRKYYWFSHSNIIYSNQSSDFASLDYRLNKTRHYLISCSRKTSGVTSFANTFSTKNTNETKQSKPKNGSKEERRKDSLEIISLPYDSLQPSSVSSHTSHTLPSYWGQNYKSDPLKVYLPQLTSINSMPVLTILEGVVISSQETHDMQLLTFAVILFHKIITALTIICEIYDRTESKLLPISTIVSFSLLPALGFTLVLGMRHLIFVDQIENRVSVLVLSVISSGCLLHIILISVRNSYMQFLLPHKNGIIQHFTMYSGFIVILGFTAVIHSRSS